MSRHVMRYLIEYMFDVERYFVRYLDPEKTEKFLENPSIHFTKILEFDDEQDSRLNDNFIEFLDILEKNQKRTEFLRSIADQAQKRYFVNCWSSHVDSYLLWNHYTKREQGSIAVINDVITMDRLMCAIRDNIKFNFGYINYEIKHFQKPNQKIFNDLYNKFQSGQNWLSKINLLKNFCYASEQEFRIVLDIEDLQDHNTLTKTEKGYLLKVDKSVFKTSRFMLSPYNSDNQNLLLTEKIENTFNVSKEDFWNSGIEDRKYKNSK